MSRFRMGSYSPQELDAMVREQAIHADAQERTEAKRTPVAFTLRERAEEAMRRVPLGEGRLILDVLSNIRASLTAFIDRGVDVSADTAQHVAQVIRTCEDKVS